MNSIKEENRRFAVVDSVRGNGFLQKLRCCARETGDMTEKTSYQNLDVCQRVQNKRSHLSNLDS